MNVSTNWIIRRDFDRNSEFSLLLVCPCLQTTSVATGTHVLQWQDYLVIGTIMMVSVVIGIYYRFSGGRQSTASVSFQKFITQIKHPTR